jgi:molecular chaperone IbpA|tara:strand:- start:529 stop:936 length:408 start_codon:yes stop_codon:yes gene_type:complete
MHTAVRSSIFNRNMFLGFEDAFKMLDHYASKSEYPPYNIERVSDDKYTLELAVAGFKKEDIDISIEKNTLKIEGESAKKDADYIHKGLASRKFTRAFHLNKYMEVDTAKMEDGILKVYLVRNVPDEEKPKHIKIS